jgi:tRNA-2-methylthio-N6-dimethylallyladenosine synthase
VARKYYVETFGCQMNYHDSERIAGLLERDGYEPAADETSADVVVLNTCSVRERAEEKLYSRLGEIRLATAGREEPVAVAVTGCVAQQEGERLLRRAPFIDAIAGTQSLKHLPRLLEEARATSRTRMDIDPHEDVAFPLGVAKPSDPTRAWVTIIEGCNEFCAFCVVPYTRGNERMRPVADILAEVRDAAAHGRVEVQLLGQIVNHYQAPDDASCDFAGLLERVNDVPGIRRIRFASPHPRHVTPGLVSAIRDLPKVCKHLHLPVQSGSSRVLHSMRRRYTRETYLEGVTRLREAIPGIEISTDIIVGYPGESGKEFEETMDLVRTVEFQSIYSFKYSVRPNTLASKRMKDDVTEGEKTRRIVALQALQRDIQMQNHTRMIGSVHEVLVDSTSRRRSWEVSGRTFGNTIVNFPGPPEWLGRVVPVRITGAAPNTVRGEALTPAPTEANHAG